jgi:hypothetical protein
VSCQVAVCVCVRGGSTRGLLVSSGLGKAVDWGIHHSHLPAHDLGALLVACVCESPCTLSSQVRPVTDERQLSRLAELSLDEVRPEFRAQVSDGLLRWVA